MIDDDYIRISAFRVSVFLEALEKAENRKDFDQKVVKLEEVLQVHYGAIDSYLERNKTGFTKETQDTQGA